MRTNEIMSLQTSPLSPSKRPHFWCAILPWGWWDHGCLWWFVDFVGANLQAIDLYRPDMWQIWLKLIKLCHLCPNLENLEMKILAVACLIFSKKWNFVSRDSWRRGRVNFRTLGRKFLHWWLRWVKYRNFIADLTPEWCESLEVYQWDKKQNMLGPRDLWDTSPR